MIPVQRTQEPVADAAAHQALNFTEADPAEEREKALCDVDSITDWLCGECSHHTAFSGGSFSRDVQIHNALRLIKTDYLNAGSFAICDLLALALGLTSNSEVRIAAMNEIARRCGVPG